MNRERLGGIKDLLIIIILIWVVIFIILLFLNGFGICGFAPGGNPGCP